MSIQELVFEHKFLVSNLKMFGLERILRCRNRSFEGVDTVAAEPREFRSVIDKSVWLLKMELWTQLKSGGCHGIGSYVDVWWSS